MEFHERLKLLRKERHITQAKLAERLAYGSTAICNYESGRNQPSYSDLRKIAEIFGVSIDYLLGITNVRTPLKSETEPDDYQAFHHYFSLLNNNNKKETLLYMQWLAGRQDKAAVNPYEESRGLSSSLKVAQKSENYQE